MAKIMIGREYEREFSSICSLFTGGFLSDEIHIIRAHGGVIETPTNVFEYREDESGVNGAGEEEHSALRFSARGASWFAPLRGVKFDSGNSDWKQLIMDVAADYHRHYSLIELKHSKDKRTVAEENALKNKFKSDFIDRVFDDGKNFVFSDTRFVEPENFYAVSLRLEINGGGESAPLLGKVFFREDADGKLSPITTEEAENVDAFVRGAVPSDTAKDPGNGIVDVGFVGKVFAGLEKSFKGKFAEYVSFNETYKKQIDEMLSQLATSEIKSLECTNVKVLGVSHVEWEKSVYIAKYRGEQVLKLLIGLNNAISLQCLKCGGTELISNNRVIPAEGKDLNIRLDPSMNGFGVSEDDIANLKENAEICDHLFTVTCPENPRNPNCTRIVCADQSLDAGNGARKCKGCRYPEIIFNDIFGAESAAYTPDLVFAADKFTLVGGYTQVCLCCGRRFTSEGMKWGGLCSFCADAGDEKTSRALYIKYGGMLSLGVRFSHLLCKKRCREDGNIILFELGKDRYVFDKLNADEYGYIKKPFKVKRGGKR